MPAEPSLNQRVAQALQRCMANREHEAAARVLVSQYSVAVIEIRKRQVSSGGRCRLVTARRELLLRELTAIYSPPHLTPPQPMKWIDEDESL